MLTTGECPCHPNCVLSWIPEHVQIGIAANRCYGVAEVDFGTFVAERRPFCSEVCLSRRCEPDYVYGGGRPPPHDRRAAKGQPRRALT